MSVDSVLIQRFVRHKLEMPEVVKLAYFIEENKSGRAMVDALLDAAEDNPVLAPDFLHRTIASLKERAERKPPANDRVTRLTTAQRRVMYELLIERDDGALCCECHCEERTVWRQQGLWNNDWGQYTKVHPTSNLEVDHRTPIWAGGTNDPGNLWLLCIDCHKKKTAQEASQRRRA